MTYYNRYDDGQMVRMSAEFRDELGNLGDPTTISLRVRDPATLDVTTYTYPVGISKDDVGLYHSDIDTTDYEHGTWFYKWIGTGSVAVAKEWAFIINHEEAI